MIEQHPELEFHLFYEEPGCDFEGDLHGVGGEVTEDDCREYRPTCIECEEKSHSSEMTYLEEEGEYICYNCRPPSPPEWDQEKNK
jgi:hypothetical protein